MNKDFNCISMVELSSFECMFSYLVIISIEFATCFSNLGVFLKISFKEDTLY